MPEPASKRSRLRDGAEWLLPPRWQAMLRRSLDGLRSSSALAANRSLAGRHADRRRAFVIGNGPSLGGMDLKPLRDEITVVANSFYKHPDAAVVNPRYVCVGDASFFTDEPRSVDWHRTVDRQYPAAVFLFHHAIGPLRAKYDLYRGRELHTFRMGSALAHDVSEVNLDLTRPLNVGHMTGSLLAIPLAFYLGVREVILLGFDATWLENTAKSYHFYQAHAQYPEFDAMAKDHRLDYELLLRSVLREFESQRLLQAKARAAGLSLVNATEGGLLDMHPRVSFKSLF